MKNIIDYVINERRSFAEKEFTAVDSLVLSQMAYLNFDDIVPDLAGSAVGIPVAEIIALEGDGIFVQDFRENKNSRKLFVAFANSPRFCNTRLAFYVNQIDEKVEKQFAAVTFLLDDDSAYVAYRGTDASLVGLKEDLNMAFISPVPSQKEGTEYLNLVAGKISCELRVGGHSKGGNIAVYSAIHCSPGVQKRIVQIYSHDGPGFRDEVLQSDGYFIIKDRINKTLPESSIIGMLLHHQEKYSVVKSNRVLFLQHDPFSWLVEDGDFIYLPSISKTATYMNSTLDQWVNLYDDEKRELIINTLFQVLSATEATTFYDLTDDWHKRAVALLGAMRGIDNETRIFLQQTFRSLLILAIKNMR